MYQKLKICRLSVKIRQLTKVRLAVFFLTLKKYFKKDTLLAFHIVNILCTAKGTL